jgi:poly-gamma-glutamate capsule biosynthesis protein CapA/YwtB (metallophosphatase superfamily)
MKTRVKTYEKFASYPVSVLFCGDIMPPYAALRNDPFTHMDETFKLADFRVANLEAPFAGEQQGFPSFSFGDDFVDRLRRFDLLITANNHAADHGAAGISRTAEVLDRAGIPHAGTRSGRGEGLSAVMKKGALAVEVFPYAVSVKGEAPSWMVSLFDEDRVAADLSGSDADIKILYVHSREEDPADRWNEYSTEPSGEWRLAPFTRLADVVVDAHPHYFQGGARNMRGARAFSLGNMLSDQKRLNDRDSGCLMLVTFDGSETRTSFVPVCTVKAGSEFHVLPLRGVREGKFGFVSSGQRESLMKAYGQIQEVLSKNNLTEI